MQTLIEEPITHYINDGTDQDPLTATIYFFNDHQGPHHRLELWWARGQRQFPFIRA